MALPVVTNCPGSPVSRFLILSKAPRYSNHRLTERLETPTPLGHTQDWAWARFIDLGSVSIPWYSVLVLHCLFDKEVGLTAYMMNLGALEMSGMALSGHDPR